MLPGLGEAAGRRPSHSLADEVVANQKKDFKLDTCCQLKRLCEEACKKRVIPRSEAAFTAQPQNREEGTSSLGQEGGEGPEASVYS